jgi:hypothetical protein
MTCSHRIESQKSNGDLADYTMNSFFIRASHYVDLDPGDTDAAPTHEALDSSGEAERLEAEEPSPWAVSVHAHEYIHYLHNISTYAGVIVFIARLWLLRSLKASADESGFSVGDDALNDKQKKMVEDSVSIMKGVIGITTWSNGEPNRNPIKWSFQDPVRKPMVLDIESEPIQIDIVTVDGVAHARHDDFPFSMQIGYHLITEGVAHEVERQIRLNDGALPGEIDGFTAPYPYLAYGALVEHLLGRPSSPRERIFIGVSALQGVSPSAALLDICNSRKGLASEQIDDRYLKAAQDRNGFFEGILKILDGEIANARGVGPGHWAGGDIRDMFEAGLKLRAQNSMLEFDLINGPLDKKAFHSWLARMVDCCVLQTKRVVQGRKVMLHWSGPGIVAREPKDAEYLGAFQASLHFASLHNGMNGKLLATSEISQDKKCPFSGACQTQIDEGMPADCDTKPWLHHSDVPIGKPACWYATGVRSFRRQAPRNKEGGDAPVASE